MQVRRNSVDAERYNRVGDLFFEASEFAETDNASPASVQTFIENRAGNDHELASQVLKMLQHHDPAAAAIEGNPSGIIDRHPSFATRTGSDRTHASPRDASEGTVQSRPLPHDLLAAQTRRQFRLTGAWLYLLCLLPTAATGAWTYVTIRDQLQLVVANELDGVSSGVRLSADRFLQDKARLVSSWSRTPDLRSAVETLSAAASDHPSSLPAHPASDDIAKELQSLSGTEDVRFLIWDRSMTTIACWNSEAAMIGKRVAPIAAADVATVLSGQTVLYGPTRSTNLFGGPTFDGDTYPGDEPLMAMMVPVEDDDNRVIAVMLVQAAGWYDQLAGIFTRTTIVTGMDAYMVDRDALMLTPSLVARTAALEGKLDFEPDKFAASMRVVDPGSKRLSITEPIDRDTRPITMAVADLRKPPYGVRIEPYANYAGTSVVGASQILNDWNLGVIVESPVAEAFAPLRLVRNSYLALAALLLATSLYAAARIAKRSADDSAAVHPLAHYDMIERLGAGGMGSVYRVRHKILQRDAALKILPPSRGDANDHARFDREARLAASLSNPHTVTIYDYGRSPEGNAYCVMQYLHGLTLQELVTRDGAQPVGRVLRIARQICDAMIESHARGLCHRDLKPHNTILSPHPIAGDCAVVFDYGLAKPIEPHSGMYQTAETVWSGTPMYMAPERFREPAAMHSCSDIYSLGAIVYFMLAGRTPYLQTEPETLFGLILNEQPIRLSLAGGNPIPKQIEDFVSRLMAKSIDDRTPSMVDVAAEIDTLIPDYPWTLEQASVWWKLQSIAPIR